MDVKAQFAVLRKANAEGDGSEGDKNTVSAVIDIAEHAIGLLEKLVQNTTTLIQH